MVDSPCRSGHVAVSLRLMILELYSSAARVFD